MNRHTHTHTQCSLKAHQAYPLNVRLLARSIKLERIHIRFGNRPTWNAEGNVGSPQNHLKAFICDMSLVNYRFVCSVALEQNTSSSPSIKVTGSREKSIGATCALRQVKKGNVMTMISIDYRLCSDAAFTSQ